MAGAAASNGPPPAQDNLYAREVRFGVVMYGGVSLAIYINGVTNELYEMACATPKVGDNQGTDRTRDVYRKASWLLGNPGLRTSYLAHLRDPQSPDPFRKGAPLPLDQRTRFVVDTIAGTSAGGINGLFLAKALANGQEFAPLKQLWILEGDLARLLNDRASYTDLEFARNDSPPQSLLNSDRMYVKLLEALQDMTPAIPLTETGGSPLVDELDLFVTTTDIRGAVVPLRLFDKVVYEKRYKQVYHFQYAPVDNKPRNDLKDENSPFLAFAARCTSSFPFAFEPMNVADAQRLCNARPNEKAIDFEEWKPFLAGLSIQDSTSDRWRKRAFGDGGYLDNKPFSYVVDALSWRLGGLPMERKLIYVEPAPSHPERESQDVDRKPDAIENALAAVFSIPQDETIRQDLEGVLGRNRRIERVERISRQVEADLETRDDPFARIILDEGNKVPDWRTRGMSDMIAYYGVAFLPYRRLRMMTVTDDIADRLAVWWGIDRGSDRLYALTALVRAWREHEYVENRNPNDDQKPTINAFLDDYDVKYRLRRVGFLLRKVHQLLDLADKLKLPEAEQRRSDIENHLMDRCKHRNLPPAILSSDAAISALRHLARGFGDAMGELRAATWLSDPVEKSERQAAANTLDQLLCLLLGEQTGTTLKALATQTGGLVELPHLPPPSPLRTLQENVFTRAKFLLQSATAAPKTGIQVLLETDLALMRTAYEKVMHPTGHPTVALALPRALLGDPQLDIPPGAKGAKPTVGIRVKDVALPACEVLNEPAGKAVREFLAEYYVRFDEYDQMSFPLYYDTGTGEPATVEVLRVSPEDAPSLIDEFSDKGDAGNQRRKLAGTALFHFGAFLDARWRRNDIMWGRLDGCERLLDALFPEAANKEVRDGLLQEAQRTIVREEMQPAEYGELIDRFAAALAAQKQSTLDQAFEGLWAHLGPDDSETRRTQTARILKSILGDAGMLDYVRRYYEVNRNLDTKTTLRTGARAMTITGQVLEEAQKNVPKEAQKNGRISAPSMVWLTRAGRGLQALLAVSTPGLLQAVFRHWLGLLYIFEALIVIGSTLLSTPSVRSFGLTALGLTVALHLVSLLVGDFIDRKHKWIMLLTASLGIVTIGLAALGILALHNHHGIHGVMCVPGEQEDVWVLQKLCKLLEVARQRL
jgi:patatin-related protein